MCENAVTIISSSKTINFLRRRHSHVFGDMLEQLEAQ